MTVKWAFGLPLTGAVNGTNQTFTLPYTPVSVMLYNNESAQIDGVSYNRSGASCVFVLPPLSGDYVWCNIEYDDTAPLPTTSNIPQCVYLIYEDDYYQSATVTTGGIVDGNYPLANSQILPIAKSARFLSTTVDLAIDLGTSKPVDLIAIIGHNLTSGAVISITAGTTTAYSDLAFSINYRETTAFRFLVDGAETYRYWRVLIMDSTNTDGYIDIGLMVMGATMPITRMFYGDTRQRVHSNFGQISEFGAEHINRGYRVSKLTAPFNNLSKSDMDLLLAMINDCEGNLIPLFIIPDTSGTDGYFGRWAVDPTRLHDFYYSSQIEFLESSPGRRVSEPAV
jgi:hypothetical protein